MKRKLFLCLLLSIFIFISCDQPSMQRREEVSRSAIEALQSGKFSEAIDSADAILKKDRGNPYACLVRAIARYVATLQALAADVRFVFNSSSRRGGFNLTYMRKALERAEKNFISVEEDLGKASSYEDIHLDLSPALWRFDWNQDGRISSRDVKLLEIEYDAEGNPIPRDDPRRRPMYRFDHGDVYWAQAFINFHIAALNIVMAFEWDTINRIAMHGIMREPEIRFKLIERGRITKSRRQILKGLDLADAARKAYLAETDDEREWLPNPRQKNHPMPLPVTEALYKTWEGVIGDLKGLVRGNTGLSMAEVAVIAEVDTEPLPRGYLDIGKMFSSPKDIVIDLRGILSVRRAPDIELLMKSIFGDYYVYGLKKSPLTSRLIRMRREINSGVEKFGRKLRYLIWLN